ncbi:hypothetical protein VTK73DRAFT_6733, partial [Phialemonium thermophilum]
LVAELAAIEADIEQVITSLPRRFSFSKDNLFVHQDRLVTFLLLHILRHNLFIVVGRAALLVYQHVPDQVERIAAVRRNRISHALPIAGLVAEGRKAGVYFDPQIGVQAYVALEILLFEPRRLAQVDPSLHPRAPEFVDALPHLLAAIREIGSRSEFVKQLHVEAVLRLLRCECSDMLVKEDMDAFYSEYRLVGQDAAEYDFRDFRWAKLERLKRSVRPTDDMVRDESLLECRGDDSAAMSTAPSPRLDAADVRSPFGPSGGLPMLSPARLSLQQPSDATPSPSASTGATTGVSGLSDRSAAGNSGLGGFHTLGLSPHAGQSWPELSEPTNWDYSCALDWSWLLDGSETSSYLLNNANAPWG